MSTFPWVCSEAMNPMMGGGGRKKKALVDVRGQRVDFFVMYLLYTLW
jgi:hypothetical protein